MYDKITEASLLYDFYARLLTERQQEITRLYHEENYSLSEIAQEFSISRQAVHDALKNAEKALREYEEKLGLIRGFTDTEATIKRVNGHIDALMRGNAGQRDLVRRLAEMKEMIGTMSG